MDYLNLIAWLVAVSSGLLAGTYFAFSSFIMQSLKALDGLDGIRTMNSINKVILRSMFMPLFFGSTILALALAGGGLWTWGEPDALWATAAGSIYVIGMFGVTAIFNVPLNNALAIAENNSNAAQVWTQYLTVWTRWNSVRAVTSLITFVACTKLL